MKENVGKVDRIIRAVIGIVLLALIFFLPGNTKYIGLIGIIPLFTAVAKWCPLYALFGINTSRRVNR